MEMFRQKLRDAAEAKRLSLLPAIRTTGLQRKKDKRAAKRQAAARARDESHDYDSNHHNHDPDHDNGNGDDHIDQMDGSDTGSNSQSTSQSTDNDNDNDKNEHVHAYGGINNDLTYDEYEDDGDDIVLTSSLPSSSSNPMNDHDTMSTTPSVGVGVDAMATPVPMSTPAVGRGVISGVDVSLIKAARERKEKAAARDAAHEAHAAAIDDEKRRVATARRGSSHRSLIILGWYHTLMMFIIYTCTSVYVMCYVMSCYVGEQ